MCKSGGKYSEHAVKWVVIMAVGGGVNSDNER